MLKCKRDGRTFIDGEEVGVENKYSNSQSKNFIDDIGYQIQCQAYMETWGLNKWVLCGMWQGKPQWRVINRNDELLKDMEEIIEAVYEILTGLRDRKDYPWHIVEKYSKQKELIHVDPSTLEDYDKRLFKTLGTIKEQIKTLTDKKDELEDYIKDNYEDCKYSDENVSLTVSSCSGRKNFDKNTFSIENPTIDVEKYMKEGKPYRTIRCTIKKVGK